jgi:LPXTG-motif cell wall-anchored protein
VSGKRASTRTASVAAVVTAVVLGLFAASAVGWYDEGGGNDTTTPTDTVPTVTTPTEEQPPPSPPIVETQPVSPPPASSAVPAAAPPEVAPALTEAVPQEGVKGEIGTRDEGQAGGSKPTVLAQATDVGSPVASESSGLAKTGFDVLFLAILGAVALAGSSLLFWRSRTA